MPTTKSTSASDHAGPDVAALLHVLREQVGRPSAGMRVREADLVQLISDNAAALVEPRRVQPDVRSILDSLREQAHHLSGRLRFQDVGTVQQVGEGVAMLSGLPRVATDELVTFPTGVQGLVLNLDRTHVDVILLGPDRGIQGGDLVTSTGQRLRIPVGHQLLGRVINPLGQPLDERGPIETTAAHYLERQAPGVIERAPVNEPLHTGWVIVDALIPIGRGQRELIIGDRQTGKTTLAVDAILSQLETDVLCVYVAVGQKKSTTLAVIESLRQGGAMPYTIVVMSAPDDPPALRYLAPYAGCTIAEALMREGRDVLIVYDDLSRHADAYRELSLLLRRPPGREAYPGDIFYLHARLLERACKLGEAHGGSLTARPIVETQRGNISAYIPTNLISITDGQIVLNTEMFHRGIKPAVDAGRSVSRVGGAAQTSAMRSVVRDLRLALAQFEEVARFARFGTEVDEATQHQIRRGQKLQAALKQPAHRPLSLAAQVVILIAATEGYLDAVPLDVVSAFLDALVARCEDEHPALLAALNRSGKLTQETRTALLETLTDHQTAWLEGRAKR
jgi:F-type H+-transporting ATPase subunit alpha